MATGQPSPQKGDKPVDEKPEQPPIPNPVQPGQNPNSAQHQSMAQAPAGNTPSEQPVKENESVGSYDAYAIDSISRDIEPWLKTILRKPETAMRDFIKGLGWLKDLGRGTVVTMFDLKIPSESLSKKITPDEVRNMLARSSKTGGTIDVKYDLVKMEPNDTNDEWKIRVKKTMTNRKYE
jgi:fibronectin type 3 domain-containing protein